MKRHEITADMLKFELEYQDGHLIWRRTKGRIKQGFKAGRIVKNGYIQTCVNGVRLLNHQIVFMMFNGFIPQEIDHINRIVSDNRIENLQETTRSKNLQNRKPWKWSK